MTNTTKHRRINDHTTVLPACLVQEGMNVNLVQHAGMSVATGFGQGTVTRIYDGKNGYRILYFNSTLVTIPDDADCWVDDPEGKYV